MKERLPALKAQDVLRALALAGFATVRTKGSHHVLAHIADKARFTVIPAHGGRDIPRHLLHKIIKQAGLSLDEFLALL